MALLLGYSAAIDRRIPISDFPCERVTGVAREGDKWLVGGIRGLFIGKPGGKWTQATDQSVREMKTTNGGTWVLYGNGSLDKVDIAKDRLYDDLMHGFTKRPWVASFNFVGENLLLGGQGGWLERGKDGVQNHFSTTLTAKPVTAITRVGSTVWLGTQDGLYRQDGESLTRLGFGSGLPDLWVTAIEPSQKSLVVGLASGGLARVTEGKAQSIDSPTKRVRSMLRWHGALVLGGLDGAWLRKGESWVRLTDSEATFLGQMGSELTVGAADGVHFFRWKLL